MTVRLDADHIVLTEALVKRHIAECDWEETYPFRPRRVSAYTGDANDLPVLVADRRVRLNSDQDFDRVGHR
jgi:hypothetical protein